MRPWTWRQQKRSQGLKHSCPLLSGAQHGWAARAGEGALAPGIPRLPLQLLHGQGPGGGSALPRRCCPGSCAAPARSARGPARGRRLGDALLICPLIGLPKSRAEQVLPRPDSDGPCKCRLAALRDLLRGRRARACGHRAHLGHEDPPRPQRQNRAVICRTVAAFSWRIRSRSQRTLHRVDHTSPCQSQPTLHPAAPCSLLKPES